ncbi:MAG: universal stress protein [Bacteroidales bacterium]|jgi:nucleotide-binding universal stress UspA family protein
MQTILIAMDYDPTAQKVAETGHALAKAMNAKVILLHVISNPVYYSSTEYSPIMGFTGYMDMSQIQLENADGLADASRKYLDKIKDHLGNKDIQTVVTEGDFALSILDTAKETKANIIVMGSHGRRWLDEILMGSVTEKVLHHSSVPLFIVPTKKHKK